MLFRCKERKWHRRSRENGALTCKKGHIYEYRERVRKAGKEGYQLAYRNVCKDLLNKESP